MPTCKQIYQYFISCLLLIAAPVLFAQNLNKKISIEVHDKPLGEVIKQIGEKGDILFSYNPQNIPVDKKITLVANKMPLLKIFEKVFTANGIEYSVLEKQVVLKPGKPDILIPNSIPEKQVQKYTLSGYVRDKTTGEAIIGASVYDPVTLQGTNTNAYGFFSVSLPKGEYRISTSFIGYSIAGQQYNLVKNIETTVELDPLAVVMNTVVITPDDDSGKIQPSQTGNIRLSPTALKQIPGFAGNIDVLKSLQNIPGIISYGDGSSFYYVRGGNSDQNLLLIDDAPIYNPSHLFGFFSALAPSAIKEVKVYKGDFPANYGGVLSSVIDIRASDGNLKKFGFAGNIGPYTSDFTIEGPILKEKCSFLVSGRKSTLNWLNFPNNDKYTYTFDFYDINSKLNILINKNNRLYMTIFSGSDVFERTNAANQNIFGISWKNVAGVLRWNHIFSSKLFSNTTAYVCKYNYFLEITQNPRNYWTSSITNATIKNDITYYLNPANTIKTGFEIAGHKSNPGKMYIDNHENQLNTSLYQSTEFVLYGNNEQKFSNKLHAVYGARLTRWNDLGPTSVYFFDAFHQVIDTIEVAKNTIYQSFWNFEPRMSVSYHFNDNQMVRLNYSHTVQHMQVLSNSTSPFTSLEVWVPSGPNIKPQKADLFSLGYFINAVKNKYDFSFEAYYKKLANQIDYKDHANMLINPLIEGELRFGKGWSYGFETMLRKAAGKLTGWISYTYSKSMKQINDINNNEAFASAYDRPHNIGITLSYATMKHWNFSSHWLYLTGAPFTSPVGFYYVNGYTLPIYDKKHNDRLPDYHRLDLSISYTFNKPENRYKHSLLLTIYNAYGRHNPFSVTFNKILDDNGNIVVPANLQGDVEIIPTSISVAGAIPSLNYIFRF